MKDAAKAVSFNLIKKAMGYDYSPIDYSEMENNSDEVLAFFKKHDLAHLLEEIPDGEIKSEKIKEIDKRIKNERFKAIYRYGMTDSDFCDICDLFESEKIPFIPLKGSVIRELYPEPWMRTSCDIDILIHEYDLDRAVEVLTKKLEFVLKHKNGHDFTLHSPSGMHFELHYNLIEKDAVTDNTEEVLKEVWNYAIPVSGSEYRYALSNEMFYFYHVAHMAKHFVNGGCGVKPFIDLMLIKDKYSLDEKKLKALLQAGNLERFSKAVESLSDVWLKGASHTVTTQQMEDYILDAGVYGNFSNKVAVKQSRSGGKMGFILARAWLPYDRIKYHYPVLQKHKWLLPLMQVRRWFKLLFCGGLKRSVYQLKENSRIKAEEAAVTSEMLKEIGLK